MGFARTRYLAKVFRRKYGVKGIVASRYLEAGYSISFNVSTKHGPVDFIAYRGKEKYAVIIAPHNAGREIVEALRRRAEVLQAKPVIIVYGKNKLKEDAVAAARELDVTIRRVRE